jgi:hypothetical protein
LTAYVHLPTASEKHFFAKLVFAAPASFFSAAEASHAFFASLSHFFMKAILSSSSELHFTRLRFAEWAPAYFC